MVFEQMCLRKGWAELFHILHLVNWWYLRLIDKDYNLKQMNASICCNKSMRFSSLGIVGGVVWLIVVETKVKECVSLHTEGEIHRSGLLANREFTQGPICSIRKWELDIKKEFSSEGLPLSLVSHLSSPDSGSGPGNRCILVKWVSNIVWWHCRRHNQTVVLIWGSESSKFQPLRLYHMVRSVYEDRFYVVKDTDGKRPH